MDFKFKAAGPGIPSEARIIIGVLTGSPLDTNSVANNISEASKLADWIYDRLTVASSRAIYDRLARKFD